MNNYLSVLASRAQPSLSPLIGNSLLTPAAGRQDVPSVPAQELPFTEGTINNKPEKESPNKGADESAAYTISPSAPAPSQELTTGAGQMKERHVSYATRHIERLAEHAPSGPGKSNSPSFTAQARPVTIVEQQPSVESAPPAKTPAPSYVAVDRPPVIEEPFKSDAEALPPDNNNIEYRHAEKLSPAAPIPDEPHTVNAVQSPAAAVAHPQRIVPLERLYPVEPKNESANVTHKPAEPKLIIGKIMIKIVPPAPPVPMKKTRSTMPAPPALNHQSLRKPSFGLGQL